MTPMSRRRLGHALRACARGIHPLEAGTGLLIDCGSWLHREDFTGRFITAGTSISDGATLLASTDWEAAITALHAGQRAARQQRGTADAPPGRQHRRRIPVSLYETLPGIDRRNASLVVGAVAHAAGHADLETDKQHVNG